jgi:phage/conjugal plasmid C-4 type zinc finger TraR family protein
MSTLREELDSYSYNNEEEAEMSQIYAIHNNMNAIARVQQELAKARTQETLSECEECGNDIPKERQQAVPGVRLCIECQNVNEKIKKIHGFGGASA